MNKKIINKIKGNAVVFLAVAILSAGFIIFSHNAKADSPSISVYYHVTPDTTPIIRGTVSDAGASVSVVIIGHVDRTATVSENGSWSLQLEPGEALATGGYAVGVASVIGGELVSDAAYIYVDEEYPLEFYYESDESGLMTSSIIFPNEYTYASAEDHFSITFAGGTVVTKTGGGTFDLAEWYSEGVDPNNERLILKLRFGIPNINLSFSHDVAIAFVVGEEYNGQTLNIFSRSDGGDDGWEPMEVSCDVIGGSCSFSTSHASYFAVSRYTSVAETEEGETGDGDDDSEKADIESWKAYQYENNNGVSCRTRLALKIKGKHLKKSAKVRIGGKKAFSVERESSKKITAKFCLEDLMKVKTSRKRTVSVTNPDTEREKSKKKINLDSIEYGKLSVGNFDLSAEEGIINVQRALYSTGFLEEQYITGFYGSLTANAVIEFQKQNNIPPTGYVGPLTKAKFEEELK